MQVKFIGKDGVSWDMDMFSNEIVDADNHVDVCTIMTISTLCVLWHVS